MAAEARLTDAGLETTGIDDTICCFAEKVETWVTDPDGERWEWYVKTADAEVMDNVIVGSRPSAAVGASTATDGTGTCCA